MMKIKKTEENGKATLYNTMKDAAASVGSKLENWKIQLYIANAINTRTRAFKCRWENVK